ncbi:hypothetical protein [Formosa haliotis]|uniref:hypothetical protein n=1 Tax=Formosa haliotis TaxID=1555194 RepID=UPI0008257C5B|nr:hypothetical protein [Formosa haliotis]
MKQFKVYKDIRKQAVIMGLPITLFGILMASVVFTLLVIIFSFSVITVVCGLILNLGLFFCLGQWSRYGPRLSLKHVFPKGIRMKYLNVIAYETDEPQGL